MLIPTIDLFSGCGGMAAGFEAAGFAPVLGVDNDSASCGSFAANFGCKTITAKVEEVDFRPRKIAPVVIGGPPCQGFSKLNKKRKADPRRDLWMPFLEAARCLGARAIVMENVPDLFTAPEMDSIRERLAEMGFIHVAAGILNAADYGAPQKRKRTVIMATRHCKVSLPEPTRDQENWLTVRDAIGGLNPPVGTSVRDEPVPYDLHFGRNPTEKSMERYQAVPPGGNRFDLQRNRPDITPDCWKNKPTGSTDLFGRLWWDRPSVTIRTEFFKPEKGRYLHPDQDRPITHREAARLQGFDDEFLFTGTKIEIARQIGNAVPPPLAEAVAVALKAALEG